MKRSQHVLPVTIVRAICGPATPLAFCASLFLAGCPSSSTDEGARDKGSGGAAGSLTTGTGGTAGAATIGVSGGGQSGAAPLSSGGKGGANPDTSVVNKSSGGMVWSTGGGGGTWSGVDSGSADAAGGGGNAGRDAAADANAPVGDSGGASPTALALLTQSFCTAARSCCAKASISIAGLSNCESVAPAHGLGMQLYGLGQVTINATALATCQTAYAKLANSCDYKDIQTACNGVFAPAQDENEPCGKGGVPDIMGAAACRSTGGPEVCQWIGDSSNPNTTGLCHPIAHGKVGDHCIATCPSDQSCSGDEYTSAQDTSVTWCFESDGLYCSPLGNTPYQCVPLTPVGSGCAADAQSCGSLNYCDPKSICRAGATIGQSCLSAQCQPSLTCGSNNTCAAWTYAFANEDFTCKSIPPSPL